MSFERAVQMACGGWISAAVGAAARLGLADLLEDGPKTVGKLAAETETNEAVLLRVMRLLVSLNLFASTSDGRFTNTRESDVLRTKHPRSMRHFCMLAAGEYDRSFGELLYTLKTGESGFHKVFDGSVYDYMDRTPEAGAVYDLAMEDLARPVGAWLSKHRDLSKVGTIVDVGGGRGTLLKALLAAAPHANGICVDRADVCARAAFDLQSTDSALARRLSFVPGDFFNEVPAGADLYLLKNVLHNWTDDTAIKILGRLREAMDQDRAARLLIIEPLLRNEPPSIHQAMDDLMQMVVCESGTTARSFEAMRALLERASFTVDETDEMPTGHAVVETRPSLRIP